MANHSLVIDVYQRLWVWGASSRAQHRDAQVINLEPTLIEEPINIRAVSYCQIRSLALDNEGQVWSWGESMTGELDAEDLIPMRVPSLRDIQVISCGSSHTLVVDNEHRVWSWGYNDYGQLGLGDQVDRKLPTMLDNIGKIRSVTAGPNLSLAIDLEDQVWGWGTNNYGQLGLGHQSQTLVPVLNPYLRDIKAVCCSCQISSGIRSYYHTSLALDYQGYIYQWGNFGSKNQTKLTPTLLQEVRDIQAISAGSGFFLALDGDGRVWSWGINNYLQLNLSDRRNREVPTLTQDLRDIRSIRAGDCHSLAIDSQGRVIGWGNNYYKQLCNTYEPDEYVHPVEIFLLPEEDGPYYLNHVETITNIKSAQSGGD